MGVKPEPIEMTHNEWLNEGNRLFGDNELDWKFVCPACGIVTMVREWITVGEPNMAAFSCIGRAMANCTDAFSNDGGPCNYAGGGLIGLNPVKIKLVNGVIAERFDFYRGGD